MSISAPTRTDRNGYAPSILADWPYCAICYKKGDLVRHEVFHGPFRQKSKRYGLWISICPECHFKIHHDAKLERRIKEFAQRNAMIRYGWEIDDFRREFGKNYVETK